MKKSLCAAVIAMGLLAETAIPVIAATTHHRKSSRNRTAEGVEPETSVSVRRAARRQAPLSDAVEALARVL